jgi:hypothetical protein
MRDERADREDRVRDGPGCRDVHAPAAAHQAVEEVEVDFPVVEAAVRCALE